MDFVNSFFQLKPYLLEELHKTSETVSRKLNASEAAQLDIPKRSYLHDESLFRFEFNEDPMAVDKLREGISKFAADADKMKAILREKIERS